MTKQLNCQKCGGNVVHTFFTTNVKSEFGFTIPTYVYKCEKCGEEHILCPECEGNKFTNTFDDCRECQGMGVISLNKIKEIMAC